MDRFLRGFIIGVLASGAKDILNLFNYYVLHGTTVRYADFMSVVLMGRPIASTADFIISQILQLCFEGLIGIVFIYFAYRTANKKYLWFKGMIFGIGAFVSFYAIGTFFRLPLVNVVPAKTVISHTITSGTYGILMGLGVYWWGKRIGDFNGNTPEKKEQIRYRVLQQPVKKIEQNEKKKVRFKKPEKL